MEALRPLTTLQGPAAVTITVTCEDDWKSAYEVDDLRRAFDKLKLPGFRRSGDALDLRGKTVSQVIAAYKAIERIRKQGAKDGVLLETTWTGEAAEFDLPALAKVPTPAEDHAVARKASKGASLTASQWEHALALMGLPATPIKEGRKLVGFTVDLPGMGETATSLHYGHLAATDEPNWREEGYTEAAHQEWREACAAIREIVVGRACRLLGIENPNERMGLPPRARDYRTDLTIRTCPVCFRDIKAGPHTHGRMADHGYTIQGRSYSGYGGWRAGSCRGTERLPWEKSCEPAKEEIDYLLELSASVQAHLAALKGGKVTELTVTGSYDWNTGKYTERTVTPADGRDWERALKRAINETEKDLAALWSRHYGSIPWMRMAVRTWQPVPDDHIAVGAPTNEVIEADFEGQPA